MTSSFSAGLVMGCMIGAIGQYCVQLFLGGSGTSSIKKNEKQTALNELFQAHSHFMEQFKKDINDPVNAQIREFFVVDKMAIMNSSIPRLRYDLSEEIMPLLNQLEDLGYIQMLPNDSLLYQINEHFIRDLNKINTSQDLLLISEVN
ncbi:hypothetical protein [Legionella rowbothamii]|uniref:hypothetical protein n=1 Tax=Legionella rowbothamii TaxID=96229 RepID=UPI001054139E|nr:hypothetical protein [Legionella rowbothamii]